MTTNYSKVNLFYFLFAFFLWSLYFADFIVKTFFCLFRWLIWHSFSQFAFIVGVSESYRPSLLIIKGIRIAIKFIITQIDELEIGFLAHLVFPSALVMQRQRNSKFMQLQTGYTYSLPGRSSIYSFIYVSGFVGVYLRISLRIY